MAVVNKVPGVELQAILNNVVNFEGAFLFNDIHALITACYQLVGIHVTPAGRTGTGTAGISDAMLNNLIKPMQAAIETQAALIKSLEDYQKKQADAETTSNTHVAANELELHNQLTSILNNIQGMKQDMATFKTHLGHTSAIIDDMENHIEANSQQATQLREMLKDHTATKHIPTSLNPTVVYAWDVQPYELGIRTKTSVPTAGHTYEYKYTLAGVETSIVASDANLKIGTELGTLTYTPLNKDVSKVVIERTSR